MVAHEWSLRPAPSARAPAMCSSLGHPHAHKQEINDVGFRSPIEQGKSGMWLDQTRGYRRWLCGPRLWRDKLDEILTQIVGAHPAASIGFRKVAPPFSAFQRDKRGGAADKKAGRPSPSDGHPALCAPLVSSSPELRRPAIEPSGPSYNARGLPGERRN